MQELGERIAKVETRLDSQDERLDRHDDKIEGLRMNDARLEAKLDNVCIEIQETKKEVGENTELTRSIKDGIKTIRLLFYCATAVLGLYLTIKQLGWM